MRNKESTYYSLSIKTRKKPLKKTLKLCDPTRRKLRKLVSHILIRTRNIKAKQHAGGVDVEKTLAHVIPMAYFGSTVHRKTFMAVVRKILTATKYECVYLSTLTSKVDVASVPWLDDVSADDRLLLLRTSTLFLLEHVVKPLIRHFYAPVPARHGYEVKLICRDTWLRFYQRVTSALIRSGCLEPVPRRPVPGSLTILPKDNCNSLRYRAIMNSTRDASVDFLRGLNKKIFAWLRQHQLYNSSLYEAWTEYAALIGESRIYAVKVDIEDAFGTADMSILTTFLTTCVLLSEDEKRFLLNRIQNQHVLVIGRRKHGEIFKWKRGLLQGDRLSSVLCEVSMSFVDRIHLSRFVRPHNFLHRTVDDFVFISTQAHEVSVFLDKVSSVYPLNHDKTIDTTQSAARYVPYCGYLIDMETKEIRTDFKCKDNENIRSRFKLWSFRDEVPEMDGKGFLKRSMTFAHNNNNFNKVQLNTVYNSEETVVRNFFEGMCLLAFKFDAAYMCIRDHHTDHEFVVEVLDETVEEYCRRAMAKLKYCRGSCYRGQVDCYLLTQLSLRAFQLVFKRRSCVYHRILMEISSRIGFICFGSLKLYVSDFLRLPEEFQRLSIKRVPLYM